jgi:hypothetical protein
MHITDLCKARWSMPNSELTPLLVPSFSSRGFPNLSDIYKYLSPFVTDISLVSAFDIHNGYLEPENIYVSDVVIIDSGGYEIKPVNDPLEAYYDERSANNWSIGLYKEVLNKLEPLSDVVIVSYDDVHKITLEKQIWNARSLFEQYPNFSGNFLWKPDPEELFCGNAEHLIRFEDDLKKFRCFGVTDKELGATLASRCRKIIEIRSIFDRLSIEIPIHVFGCLDPLTSLLFFLCGADVFDGLSWLRYVYREGRLIYLQQAALLEDNSDLSDYEILSANWIDNLETINKTQNNMKAYSQTFDPSSLYLSDEDRRVFRSILDKVGISTDGVL